MGSEGSPAEAVGRSVYDFDELLERCLGNRELAIRILMKFEGELCSVSAELRQAIDATDADAVARIAHRLKGTVASVGAGEMSDQFEHIIGFARAGQFDDGLCVLDHILASFSRSREDVARWTEIADGTSSSSPAN